MHAQMRTVAVNSSNIYAPLQRFPLAYVHHRHDEHRVRCKESVKVRLAGVQDITVA